MSSASAAWAEVDRLKAVIDDRDRTIAELEHEVAWLVGKLRKYVDEIDRLAAERKIIAAQGAVVAAVREGRLDKAEAALFAMDEAGS